MQILSLRLSLSLSVSLSQKYYYFFLTWQMILYRPLLRLRRASACHLCLPLTLSLVLSLPSPRQGDGSPLSSPSPWLGILHPPLPTGPTGKQVLRLATSVANSILSIPHLPPFSPPSHPDPIPVFGTAKLGMRSTSSGKGLSALANQHTPSKVTFRGMCVIKWYLIKTGLL